MPNIGGSVERVDTPESAFTPNIEINTFYFQVKNINRPPTDILTAGPVILHFFKFSSKFSNCNQIASRLNMGCKEKGIRKRLWSGTKNKPSENHLFLALREESLKNCRQRVLKGRFQDSIPSCFLTAVKNTQERRTAGRLLIPPSGTRRVRWKIKRAPPAATPGGLCWSLAIVWLGVVERDNPWYAIYLFHHQRRGSDLQFYSISECWTKILRRDAYLLTLRPPGIVAS